MGRTRIAPRADLPLVAAVAVCLAVSGAVLISLWDKLTMPFWFNEQWRAFYVSDPGDWWKALGSDGAPFAAGWYFLERASSDLFGSTELSLRLPTALFLPASSLVLLLLARRWMPLVAAVVVSLVGSLVGSVVVFAVQLSEYGIDAAAAVAVILFHDTRSDAARGWRLHLSYAGTVLACILSTPVIFLAGPLLLLDLARAVRRHAFLARGIEAVVAGGLILAHLGLFVLRQNALTHSSYWDAQFMPHRGLGSQLRFVWDGLRGFVTSAFTGSLRPTFPILLSTRWSWPVTAAFTILLVAGVAHLARSERGRAVLFAVAGAVVLTLIASYLRYWPFGFVRTNFYLLPVLMFIAGVGGTRVGAYAAASVWPARRGRTLERGRLLSAALGCALVAVMTAGTGLAAVYDVGAYRQVADSARTLGYGAGIRAAVAEMRRRAAPGAVVVVAGYMAEAGWTYYQYEYSGRATLTGPQIPRARAVIGRQHGAPEATRLVRRDRPSEVFLYVPNGTTEPEIQQDVAAIAGGCRTTATFRAPSSGVLYTMSCHP